MLYKNSSGYIGTKKEEELYQMIIREQITLQGLKCKQKFPILSNTRDVPDFLFVDENSGEEEYIEVKPWFLKIKDIQQLVKYLIHIREERSSATKLGVLCAGVSDERKEILEKLSINIYLIRDSVMVRTGGKHTPITPNYNERAKNL